MRIVWTVIFVAALGAGGYLLWRQAPREAEERRWANRPTTAVAEYRDIEFNIIVAGEIAPAEQVSVRPEIHGRIATLDVDIGDRVKKGDVLFNLDDKELRQQKSSVEVEVDRARLQLEQARRDFQRAEQLFKANLLPMETYEASRTSLELASNALQRAERELDLLEERLTKTKIVAPFDCTVLTRPVSVGQAVAGSSGMAGGTEVLVIADLNNLIINAHVNQADVTHLKPGMMVAVAIEAIPGLAVTGQVERIAPQATLRNNIKGFATRIALKNVDPRIQPGMTANITIPVGRAEGALAVPLAAVFTEQNERFVYVKQPDGQFEKRPVQIGLSDYFYAEVVSGLEEGEVVALEPPPGVNLGAARAELAGSGKAGGPADRLRNSKGGERRGPGLPGSGGRGPSSGNGGPRGPRGSRLTS